MDIKEEITLDLIPQNEPALSSRSDIPVVETKPDAENQKPAPEEAKAEDAAPDEGKKAAESAPAEEPEDPAANAEPEKKPAKGVQKRIDELVRQREDAERRADAEKQEKLRLLALVESARKPEAKPEPEEDPEPQRPDRSAFTEPSAYEEALAEYADQKADWSAKRAVKDAIAQEHRRIEQRQMEEGKKAALEAYNGRVSKVAEKYPDYKQVAESPDVAVSMTMAHAILQSEHGPEIQYHLGKNPDEAKRLSALNPVQQLVELGLMVAKLTAPEAAPAPKPSVSAAPKPIKPLASGSESAAKSPDEESMDEYAARRTKELQAARRPGVRH